VQGITVTRVQTPRAAKRGHTERVPGAPICVGFSCPKGEDREIVIK